MYIVPYTYRRRGKEYKSCLACRREANSRFKARVPVCHPERKHRLKGLCASCLRQERLQGPDKEKFLQRERELGRKYYARNVVANRLAANQRTLRKFGLTLTTYQQMYEAQSGVCAICNNPEKRVIAD